MVTTKEARSQLQQRKREITQQKKRIQETRLKELSRAELQKRTRQQLASRQLQQRQLGVEKEKILGSIQKEEKVLTDFEKEIAKVEKTNEAIRRENERLDRKRAIVNVARKFILAGRETTDPVLGRKIKELKERGFKSAKELQERALAIGRQRKQLKTLESVGLIPIFSNGNLTGFEDTINKKSINLEGLGFIQEERLIKLEREGIIKRQVVKGIEIREIPQVGIVKTKDVGQPLVIKETPKGLKKIDFIVKGIITKTIVEGTKKLRKLTEDVITAVTIPESLAKETKVKFIAEKSELKGTSITRPVSFQDIGTGTLPPKQNLDLATQKIIIDFNLGKITENKALTQLKDAQKDFILSESKRTAALRLIEGAGIGVLTAIAPPLGFTIIGLTGTNALLRRKEILTFARTNPRAAAIQFVAGVLGGFAGAGGVSKLKIRAAKITEPTILLKGSERIKIRNTVLQNLEKSQLIKFETQIRATGTRVFEIDIPSPKNKITLKILEFTKDGKKQFIGIEFVNGKPKSVVGGLTIVSSKKGIADLITRSIRTNTKGGLTNVELSEFFEKATIKAAKTKGGRSVALTESEVRLSKQFNLKGLAPNQVREILRRPLFGVKEAEKRSNTPFTKEEFSQAKKLSKSQVITSRDIVKSKLTFLSETLEPLLLERSVITIKAIESGKGLVDFVVDLPRPKVVGVKPKDIKLPGKIKIPIETRGLSVIKIIKGKPPKRTPLAKTFGEQSQAIEQILKSRVTKASKLKRLKKLKENISPVGAFKAIAKRIQKERISLAKKQALGQAISIGVATGVKIKPLTVEKQVLKIKSILKQTQKVATTLIDKVIITQAEKLSLAGKLTQVQVSKLKLLLVAKGKIIPITTAKPMPVKVPPVIPKIPEGVSKTALVSALSKLGKQGVDVLVGLKKEKQRLLFKGLPPFKALKKARRFVDQNIEASFSLVPTGKITKKKDIKPFNVGMKFRPSKTNPLFVVEKRKFRLDSPTERRQLKAARRRKRKR